MKSYQEGEWTVTTPVYFGSEADIQKAQACAHLEYKEVVRRVEDVSPFMKGPMLMVHEKCEKCVASRVKYRPAEGRGDSK